MILFYALARLHDFIQAVSDAVHRDPEDGSWRIRVGEFGADFGDGWGVMCPWFVAMSPDRIDDDEDDVEPVVELVDDPNGEGEPERKWRATPDAWRSWFEAAAAGEDVDSLMLRLELQGVGEGIEA